MSHTGLSPAKARLSRRFCCRIQNHWPGPRSLATTNGISVDVFSSGYLDVSVLRVRFSMPMYSAWDDCPTKAEPSRSSFQL